MTEKFRHTGVDSIPIFHKSNGVPLSVHGNPVNYCDGLQVIDSESHAPLTLGKMTLNDGGPFTSNKMWIDWKPLLLEMKASYNPSTGTWGNEYEGLAFPAQAVVADMQGMLNQDTVSESLTYLAARTPNRPSSLTLDAFGAKAVDIVKPTNPTADLVTSLAEFWAERKFFALPGTAGSLPGEYLNYMFGIAPTVSLVQDLRKAIDEQEKITRQYVRDSGRWVRRRLEFDPTRSITKVSSAAYPAFLGTSTTLQNSQVGTLTTITSQYQKYWFSGAFTYHLPKEGIARDLAVWDRLYGVKPGLSTPWELLPFSWLLDYKLSFGDVLSNADSFIQDGLVMPYGYVMCHTKRSVEYSWTGNIRDASGAWYPRRLTATIFSEQKVRRAANPFGFGITPGSLNARQLSILAALGLTLGGKKRT